MSRYSHAEHNLRSLVSFFNTKNPLNFPFRCRNRTQTLMKAFRCHSVIFIDVKSSTWLEENLTVVSTRSHLKFFFHRVWRKTYVRTKREL